jgi:hypothetical protein
MSHAKVPYELNEMEQYTIFEEARGLPWNSAFSPKNPLIYLMKFALRALIYLIFGGGYPKKWFFSRPQAHFRVPEVYYRLFLLFATPRQYIAGP